MSDDFDSKDEGLPISKMVGEKMRKKLKGMIATEDELRRKTVPAGHAMEGMSSPWTGVRLELLEHSRKLKSGAEKEVDRQYGKKPTTKKDTIHTGKRG